MIRSFELLSVNYGERLSGLLTNRALQSSLRMPTGWDSDAHSKPNSKLVWFHSRSRFLSRLPNQCRIRQRLLNLRSHRRLLQLRRRNQRKIRPTRFRTPPLRQIPGLVEDWWGRSRGRAFKVEVQQKGLRLLTVFCSRDTSSVGC